MSCDCIGSKTAAASVLILISIIFGFLPLLMRNCLKNANVTQTKVDKIIGISLVFGAGVLFSMSIQHMLFETREGLQKLNHSGFIKTEQYPLAELFICTGFLFIYAFEEIIMYMFTRGTNTNVQTHCEQDANHASDSHRVGMDSETDISKIEVDNKVSFLRTIIFMFAIYMHTLFEGLAVGIADTPSQVWILTGAIAAHKIFIAFSTGNELLTQSKRVYMVSISLLVAIPTVGTMVGAVLAEEMKGSEMGDFILSLLTGISGGVIMFVVFFEILEKERLKSTYKIQNMIAFTVGFACMATILLIPEA